MQNVYVFALPDGKNSRRLPRDRHKAMDVFVLLASVVREMAKKTMNPKTTWAGPANGHGRSAFRADAAVPGRAVPHWTPRPGLLQSVHGRLRMLSRIDEALGMQPPPRRGRVR